MEPRKQLEKIGGQFRELLAKLTVSQRITIGLLGGVVAAGVVIFVTVSRSEAYVRLCSTSDQKTASSLRALLDQHGILYRITPDAGGSLEVPHDRAAHARWLAAESGMSAPRDTNLDWLWGDGNLMETSGRFDQ